MRPRPRFHSPCETTSFMQRQPFCSLNQRCAAYSAVCSINKCTVHKENKGLNVQHSAVLRTSGRLFKHRFLKEAGSWRSLRYIRALPLCTWWEVDTERTIHYFNLIIYSTSVPIAFSYAFVCRLPYESLKLLRQWDLNSWKWVCHKREAGAFWCYW